MNTFMYIQKISTLSGKNREIKKSKAAAQSLYKQIKYHKDRKLFGSCETIVSIFGWNHKRFYSSFEQENHLKICRQNLKLLKEKKSKEQMFQDELSQKYLESKTALDGLFFNSIFFQTCCRSGILLKTNCKKCFNGA